MRRHSFFLYWVSTGLRCPTLPGFILPENGNIRWYRRDDSARLRFYAQKRPESQPGIFAGKRRGFAAKSSQLALPVKLAPTTPRESQDQDTPRFVGNASVMTSHDSDVSLPKTR
jgi:hypothetical protein